MKLLPLALIMTFGAAFCSAEEFERVFGESASRFGIEKSLLTATCSRLQHGDFERQVDDEAPQLILRS